MSHKQHQRAEPMNRYHPKRQTMTRTPLLPLTTRWWLTNMTVGVLKASTLSICCILSTKRTTDIKSVNHTGITKTTVPFSVWWLSPLAACHDSFWSKQVLNSGDIVKKRFRRMLPHFQDALASSITPAFRAILARPAVACPLFFNSMTTVDATTTTTTSL